jgi:hypothetical protein
LTGYGLTEDQPAIGEVDLDVFLRETQMADAVTLVAIEGVFPDSFGDFAHTSISRGKRERQGERNKPSHGPSLQRQSDAC